MAKDPNYCGGKETTECKLCGESFEYYPSEKEGLYCPNCVETKEWRELPPLDGENNPRWKGGKLELECAACGATFHRYPSDVTGEATVCNRECLILPAIIPWRISEPRSAEYFHEVIAGSISDWLSEEFTGEGHPNWKGGDTGNYGPGWNRVRRNALERDDYECVVCGATKADIGRNPDIHHIVPVRVYNATDGYEKSDAHQRENVVSLCLSCHRRADFGHIQKETLWEKLGVNTADRPGPASKVAEEQPRR